MDGKKENNSHEKSDDVTDSTAPEETGSPTGNDVDRPLLHPNADQPIDDRFYEGKWWQRSSFNRNDSTGA